MEESKLKAYEVPMNEIYCDNDFNCRGSIAPIDVIDLARSIDTHGLQQSIVIQPYNKMPGFKYRIVSGHRRYWAFKVNRSEKIPAVIKEGLSELDAKQLNLEENLKRKDLNILQEANAIKTFIEARWPQDMIAARLGQSRGWVQARVSLLMLPIEVQREAAAGFLTQEHVKQLATIKDPERVAEAVRNIKDAKLRGEKGIRAKVKKENPLSKKPRDRNEIFQLQEMIQDAIGNNLATRCLGWAAGEISKFDVARDLKEYCEEQGIDWEIPRYILDAVEA